MPLAWKIRPIEARDDAVVAAIIRTVMPEYGAVGEGFAINDPEVDWMQRAYSLPRSVYFVVELEGKVVGGGGIAPLAGSDEDTCELRKMYFLKQLRGQGAGSAMMKRCLDAARNFGYRRCYLETMCSMNDAIRLYERNGFRRVGAPLGNTGHGGCNTFYLLELQTPPPRENVWDEDSAAGHAL
ncbi:MAG TPA: GNAT family N-acetyltransferase [Lysobacter sp.]|nr:GNAT family N-acetyltransferase [Lysobacter sp.]